MSRSNPELSTNTGIGNFARLKNLSKATGKDVKTLSNRSGLEAAIRRIFASAYADRFGVPALKGGALMFFSEGVEPAYGRGTGDIDVQIAGFDGTLEELRDIMREVLAAVPSVDDGVRFDADKLTVRAQREGGVPGGSIETVGQVGGDVVKLKIDVGFYDAEHSADMIAVDYPSLLPGQLSPVRIWRQPIEWAVTDKIHAAFKHAGTNTRMTDYYDLFVICTRCDLDDDLLRRGFGKWQSLFGQAAPGSIDDIASYGDAFVEANAADWDRLRLAGGWAVPAPDLKTVVRIIRDRIGPVMSPTYRRAA